MKDYQDVLKYLQRSKDEKIPKIKKDLVELHEECKWRTLLTSNERVLSVILTVEEENIDGIGILAQTEDDAYADVAIWKNEE